MISAVIQGGEKRNLKMEIIVILALFTLVSTSHVGSSYVYEKHHDYEGRQSSTPFMILSPPQPRQSFRTPQFAPNTPSIQSLRTSQRREFVQQLPLGSIQSLPAQRIPISPNNFRRTEQIRSLNTIPDFQTGHKTLPHYNSHNFPYHSDNFPHYRSYYNNFPHHNSHPNNFPHFQSSNIQPRPILPLPSPQPTISPRSQRSLQRTQTSPLCHPSKNLVDETRNGQSYHLSWCHDGGASYSWEDAKLYCQMLGSGFRALSIEDQGENNFISNIIQHHDIPWIWTSGNKIFTTYWVWHDGSKFTYTNWSSKGGSGMPQPDNRENNNEKCLAILNDFYQDGIKWHDIACHHEKHVICEAFYVN